MGGGLTVIVLAEEVVTANPLSRALATMTCVPSTTFDQTKE